MTREQRLAQKLEHRNQNREAYNAAMRRWRARNPERVRANFQAWRAKNPDYYTRPETRKRVALCAARARAKRNGVEFSITAGDLTWPETCPVLGIRLNYSRRGRAGFDSPSIDRTDPRLGYVPGNVVVMSNRANMLKKDASFEELIKLGAYAGNLTA